MNHILDTSTEPIGEITENTNGILDALINLKPAELAAEVGRVVEDAAASLDLGFNQRPKGRAKLLEDFITGESQPGSPVPAIPLQPSDLSQFRIRTGASDRAIELASKPRIGKPKSSEWFHTFLLRERFEIAVFTPADGDRDSPYLLTPRMAEAMSDACKMGLPVVWTTPNGVWGVWIITVPDPARQNSWVDSAWKAAHQAAGQWRRVASNMAQGQYIISVPMSPVPLPDRPSEDWLQAQIMGAFEGRIIDSPDHPACKSYQMNS